MPIFVAGVIWVGADILGAVGFFTGNSISNTGNLAHLSGMLFGMMYGLSFRKWNRKKKENFKIVFDESSLRNWEDDHLR